MLIAVVTQAQVLFVGLSVLMPLTLSVVLAGILALPYHLNQIDELLPDVL